jgi:hypothetical protein
MMANSNCGTPLEPEDGYRHKGDSPKPYEVMKSVCVCVCVCVCVHYTYNI